MGNREKNIFFSIKISSLAEENQRRIRECNQKGIIYEEYGYYYINIIFHPNDQINTISTLLEEIAAIFVKQELTTGFISVEEQYQNLSRLLVLYNIPFPDHPSTEEKIAICCRANEYLTLSTDKQRFYFHPSLKEKAESPVLTKK